MSLCDDIIVVAVSVETQNCTVGKAKRIYKAEALERIQSQMPLEEKGKESNYRVVQ